GGWPAMSSNVCGRWASASARCSYAGDSAGDPAGASGPASRGESPEASDGVERLGGLLGTSVETAIRGETKGKGPGDPQRPRGFAYRCYLPVLTGFTNSSRA